VKMGLFALIACCVAVLAAATGDQRERQARAGPGAAASGPHAPRSVHPRRPSRYRLPRRAIRVSSAQELRAALQRRARTAIVLANGSYDSARPFSDAHGHRLYAATVGHAVLRAGLSVGGNAGRGDAIVRGLVVDVRDPSRTVDGAAIAVWGRGRGTRILDTTVRGHGVLSAGVQARQPDGLVIERLVARRFRDFGVSVDANDPGRPASGRGFSLEDVDVAGVSRPRPGSSMGTAEACLWIGDAGSVRRVRARSCAWSGVWTGTATRRTRFDAIDIDRARTGVYLEHFTHGSTFSRLRIGPSVRVGLTAEWADPGWGGRPASVDNVIEDSRFESALAGVYLDEGTTRTTVRRSTFAGQSWAGIADYRGRHNRYYANDFRSIDREAEAVRHDHLSSIREG
jgi:hypothetical protein